MTSDTGFKIPNDRWSLRAGKRGPLAFQDIHFYRKQSRFNRERIPEKVVHARGFGVYGDFELTKSMKEYTVADFLQEPGTVTPVFTRFSNFIGNKGSKDTAVDIRGFAVKFYTQEGNYDMLSLQFPVFIMSDAIKFMDVTHAVKPNQTTDIPQATVAHERFWDYVANNQESAHMVMWLMSLRGRPRSWRMMEGWPINTFRFINKDGKSTFVRFVWKPKLGVHSLLMEEANMIGGIDPDFHRRDMIEAIEKGAYPEYELGVQLVPDEDEFKYDFDVLDSTKLWPEEVIPVEIIGKLTLNRLVDNFFAEEEQSSFDPSTLIPGIGFTNDPVLQGRSFAYRDTDYHRLGTGNINEIPVNKPITEVNTNFRDSFSKYPIDEDNVTHHENSLAGNTPAEVSPEEGGYAHYPEKVEGYLTSEAPSESFLDYFSQARLFWNSLASFERKDLIDTFTYHLQYVKSKSVREQNVEMWANVDEEMASILADRLGVERPKVSPVKDSKSSPALSMANTAYSASTQKVGVLIGDGFDGPAVKKVLESLQQHGAFVHIISENLGTLTGNDGTQLEVQETFKTKHPVLYDAFYIVGGSAENQEEFNQYLMEFYYEAYKHYKPIGIAENGDSYIEIPKQKNPLGVVFAANNPEFGNQFIDAITQTRFWDRK
ncbi:catalase [Carnobacterium sp. CS13]|uniref:catalase n=1 Tax=Carnobacterium sp. CS13 TaxID=2800128 RepID=UPI001913F6D2|nr:catalase [Carnobacterium sp. CS13]QQP70522.1 catalase [Carnobacterium sp. CS13]